MHRQRVEELVRHEHSVLGGAGEKVSERVMPVQVDVCVWGCGKVRLLQLAHGWARFYQVHVDLFSRLEFLDDLRDALTTSFWVSRNRRTLRISPISVPLPGPSSTRRNGTSFPLFLNSCNSHRAINYPEKHCKFVTARLRMISGREDTYLAERLADLGAGDKVATCAEDFMRWVHVVSVGRVREA